MKINYSAAGVALCLYFTGINNSPAQSSSPEFLDIDTTAVTLCISDEGVSLPDNNQLYWGETNPNATSCSVHLSQKIKIKSYCGMELQYEVEIYLYDTSNAILLQPLTTVVADSSGVAEIYFESSSSPDDFIRKNGIPYTSGCYRYHRIKWTIRDSCEQESIFEKRIDLYDCSKPLYSLPDPFYTINFGCDFFKTIRLSDIITALQDDCTSAADFSFSFSPDYIKPDSTLFICDVPAYGVEVPYDVWIADKGRDLDCNGKIRWSERNLDKIKVLIVFTDSGCYSCEPEEDPYLIGEILTKDVQSVQKVNVTLKSPGYPDRKYTTTEDGRFAFYTSFSDSSVVTAERNDNHRNGVSTLDLVRIQKHLLGIEPLTSPYDIIAADANNNQQLSILDLIAIRKLILNIDTSFHSNTSWRFVPRKFIFQDTKHPWPFPDSIVVSSSGYNFDFVAIKIGDVNNTVQANAQSIQNRDALPAIKWYVDQRKYSPGEIINIDFHIGDPQDVQGFQFTITDPDLEFIDATSEVIHLTNEHFALFDDKMTFSWFDENGIHLSDHDAVFTLKARAKSAGELLHSLSLNSTITEAEMYSTGDDIFIPKLMVDEKPASNFSSMDPNPWKDETKIHFYLSKKEQVNIELFDLNGRLVYSKTVSFNAGDNDIILHATDFASRGILFYTVKSGAFVTSNKMIVIP